MEEGSGNEPAVLATADEKKRKKFDQFDTELLRAWLLDYPDWKKFMPGARAAQREDLLTVLVQKGALPPGRAAANQLAAMQTVWRKRGGPPGSEPGFHQVPIPPAVAVAAPPPAAPPAGAQPPAAVAAPVPIPPVVDPEEEVGDEEEDGDMDFFAAPAAAAAAAGGAASPPAPIQRWSWAWGCQTCTTVPLAEPQGPVGAWVCHCCGLRGDLPASDPGNAFLAKKALLTQGQKAPVAAASQSTATTASSHAAKLEAHLTSLAAELGGIHPDFVERPPGDVSFTPERAVIVSASALGASMFAPPSAALLRLIQSGKLLRTEFALPVPFLQHTSTQEHVARIEFGAAGLSAPTIVTSKNPCDPPPLANIEEFDTAMYATIIPALITRPEALIQWVALARTVHEVNTSMGWISARSYLNGLLQNRSGRPDKVSFAQPHTDLLRDIREKNDRQQGHDRFFGQGQRAPAPSGAAAKAVVCHDFNGNGCIRAACRFSHLCAVCNGSHAASKSAQCSSRYQVRASGPSSAPLPSRGKSGAGRGSAGSVKTAAAAPVASPIKSPTA